MKNFDLLKPVLYRVFIVFLAALGGWLAANYPAEVASLCRLNG